MAQAPDPIRHPETDPELAGREQARDGMSSPKSTRLGLSSRAIVIIVVLLAIAILVILA